MRSSIWLSVCASLLFAGSLRAQKSGADSGPESLLQVRRVYVAQLTGGAQADALRELIIASLNGTKLFILTDNPDHADAILKGAADDHSFTDTHEKSDSANGHGSGNLSSGSTFYGRTAVALTEAGGENESYRIKERKHEAYAAVRLCSKDGDVLWSTTQESLGAKFRGASADVAAKVARQLTLDMDRARHPDQIPPRP